MGNTQKLGTLVNGLTVDSSGNVGLGGAANVSYKLAVTGNIIGTGTGFDFYTSSGIGSSSVSGLLRVVTAGTSTGIAIGQSNSARYTAISANEHIVYGDDFFMRTNGAFPLSLGTNNTIRMTITSTGNVGIGTSSPTNSLTIKAAATNKGIDFTSLADNSVIVGSINFEQTNDILSIIQKTAYSGGAVVFGTNSTERMRILANGNIGIGTNSPSSKLGVKTTGADGIVLEQDLSDASNSGRLFFLSTTQNYGVLNNAGDLRFTYGAQPANTSGTSLARFTNTGKYFRMESGTGGIQFQGTTSSSNALNYYEEGTWTPILSGSNGGNYTAAGGNTGKYTRVGNVVTITCTLVWNGGGPYSGNMCVRGIPFTNGGNRCHGSMGAIAGGLSLSSGYTYWSFLIDPGYTFVYIIQNSSNGYSHGATVGSSGTIYAMTLTYLI